jgi:multiple sugar transport system substrate-binding protein
MTSTRDRITTELLKTGRIDRRTFLAGSAALAASTGLLRGTAAQTPAALSGDLLMWAYPLIGDDVDGEMWDKIIEGFNALHPDVNVNVELQPWDRRVEKLLTAMAVDAGPDVWYINLEDVPTHAIHGRLVSLDDTITGDDRADFLPASLDAMSWDDTLWAAPILIAVYGSFYNKDIFAKAGITDIPVTWDELRAAGPILKDAGYYLTQYENYDPQAFFYPLVWQAGGEPFIDGKPAFNSPEGVKALDFVVEMFNNDWTPASGISAEGIAVTEKPLGLGEVALALPSYGSWDIVQISEAWGEGVLEITDPPKDVDQVSTGGAGGYAVWSGSSNQDAAKAWVQFITNPENSTLINKTSGYLPPRMSVGNIQADDPILGPLAETLPFMRAFPNLPGGRQILTDALGPEIEAAILGKKSSQEALDAAATRAQEIIDEQSAA